MDNLLNNKFTAHYSLPPSCVACYVAVNEENFNLCDAKGGGRANFENRTRKTINYVNYESFVDALPVGFQHERRRCDYIVHTASDRSHFLLCELTRTKNKTASRKRRRDKKKQLQESLRDIFDVPEIRSFMAKYEKCRCCLFNERPPAPALPGGRSIIAPMAFNPSLQKEYEFSEIGMFGFEPKLYEFSGTSAYVFS